MHLRFMITGFWWHIAPKRLLDHGGAAGAVGG
jgi:hypothetical protein